MWKRLFRQNFLGKKPSNVKLKKISISEDEGSNSIDQGLIEDCVQQKRTRQDISTLGESSGSEEKHSTEGLRVRDEIADSVERVSGKRKKKDLVIIDESIQKKRKKSRKGLDTMAETVDLVDRTALLPEPIIHHILSLLCCRKDAARTSILSKRWNRMWISYYGLEFDQHEFQERVLEGEDQENKKKMFWDFVDQSIQRHLERKYGVQKFALHIPSYEYDFEYFSHMNRWIAVMVQNGIKELDLRLPIEGKWHYNLPQTVFASKYITSLRLQGCKWKASADIKLPNLKRLCLRQIHINQQKIENLVFSCPSVEDMRFINCCRLQNLQVSSLKLHTVEVYQCRVLKKIELEAPNLHTFRYSGKKSMHCKINLSACKSLKVLTLEDPKMTGPLFYKQLSNFPVLEKLELSKCHHLRNIKVSGQHLKNLVLRGCKNLIGVYFFTPNLVFFEYKGDTMPFFSMNPWGLEEVKIHVHRKALSSEVICKIRRFLKRFGYSKKMKLVINTKKCVVIHEDFTEILLPISKDLDIEIKSPTNLVEQLDNVLKIWQPHYLTIVSSPNSEVSTQVRDKLWKREQDPSCCRYKTNRCWRHYLDNITDEPVSTWIPWLSTYSAVEQQVTAFRLFWSSCKTIESPQESYTID